MASNDGFGFLAGIIGLRWRRLRWCGVNSDTYSDSVANALSNPDPNAHSEPNANAHSDTYAVSDSNAHTHAVSDTHSNAIANTHSDPYANAVSNGVPSCCDTISKWNNSNSSGAEQYYLQL